MAFPSGMNGLMKTVILARYMDTSGEAGRHRMAKQLIAPELILIPVEGPTSLEAS